MYHIQNAKSSDLMVVRNPPLEEDLTPSSDSSRGKSSTDLILTFGNRTHSQCLKVDTGVTGGVNGGKAG